MTKPVIVCADVGSTYTKVAAVGADDGHLYGFTSAHTTIDSDVLHGLHAARDAVLADLPADAEPIEERVCSSAGGGLRLAVIGNEPLVTATAAHRAGLSAGAVVVSVTAGRVDDSHWRALADSRPDVVLLSGGTDGGDETVLIDHAQGFVNASMVDIRLRVPVVVAANSAATAEVAAILSTGDLSVITVDNVLPRIGRLNPLPARLALREAFLKHVIAGKHLSTQDKFAAMVRSATPDTVLSAVELFADGHAELAGSGDVVVVDVGGATTDVYSVLTPDAELSGPRREVAGTAWRSRTVEGDLGLRHTAPGIVVAAASEGLLTAESDATLGSGAEDRSRRPGWLPVDAGEIAADLRLTELAIMIALRRHARGMRVDVGGGERSGPGVADGPIRGGKDLRAVNLIVGSGGVLRNHGADAAAMLEQTVSADTAGGYPLPTNATTVIDASYVLAAAGLLADDWPYAALRLMRDHLIIADLPGAEELARRISRTRLTATGG